MAQGELYHAVLVSRSKVRSRLQTQNECQLGSQNPRLSPDVRIEQTQIIDRSAVEG